MKTHNLFVFSLALIALVSSCSVQKESFTYHAKTIQSRPGDGFGFACTKSYNDSGVIKVVPKKCKITDSCIVMRNVNHTLIYWR